MEQTDLRTHRTPARLGFADQMNRFIAGDRAPSSPEGAEMLTGVDPPLDGAVVLLEHVVQIEEKTRNGILRTPSVNPPRKPRMSFRQRSVTYV